jgi:hypothetical protein
MSTTWSRAGARVVDFFAAEFPVADDDTVRQDLTWMLPL